MKGFNFSVLLTIVTIVLTACTQTSLASNTAEVDDFTPTPQVPESTAVQTNMNDRSGFLSNDQMGFCFFYPLGYTVVPSSEPVEIAAPDLPGSDAKGLFWLETSDAYDRTAEKIADEDMTSLAGSNIGRWTVTLDNEAAVVLDGMPGQELQRRVYVVHQQTLYVLAFWPTLSENKPAGDQMELLYTTITNSWAWTPCSANK